MWFCAFKSFRISFEHFPIGMKHRYIIYTVYTYVFWFMRVYMRFILVFYGKIKATWSHSHCIYTLYIMVLCLSKIISDWSSSSTCLFLLFYYLEFFYTPQLLYSKYSSNKEHFMWTNFTVVEDEIWNV